MAAKFLPKEFTISTTPATLSSLIGQGRRFVTTIAIRAANANTQPVYLGGSDMTSVANRGGFLLPGDALTIDLSNDLRFSTDDVFLVAGSGTQTIHLLGYE